MKRPPVSVAIDPIERGRENGDLLSLTICMYSSSDGQL